MNNKNLSVLAIVALSIATMGLINNAHAAQFEQYGTIGQEDQLIAKNENGLYYVNTGTAYGIGNGMFEQVNEISDNFSINGAINTFGIYEDTETFIYEPILSNGKYSNVLFMYNLEGQMFELVHIYADESGINEELTQLENRD